MKTAEDLGLTLTNFADQNKADPWILGRGIRYNIVSTRYELDAISTERPIYVESFDGHTA